jgi:hypothetical protein
MPFVQEPVLFFWIFLPKSNQPEVQKKVEALDAGLELPALTLTATEGIAASVAPAGRASACNSGSVVPGSPDPQHFEAKKVAHSSRGDYQLLERFERTSAHGARDVCLFHAYQDALLVQVALGKDENWHGTLTTGLNELIDRIQPNLNSTARFGDEPYGISTVYWAISDDEVSIDSYAEEIRLVCAQPNLPSVPTDLGGQLWHCEQFAFASLDVPQDLWLLVTSRSAESIVNRRFNRPFHNAPPTFATMAVAAHKIRYEEREHASEIRRMQSLRESIDQKASDIVKKQQASALKLENLRSRESEELGWQLAEANAVLANYRRSINVLKRLRRTIAINRRNFLINGVELISAKGKSQVEGSPDWEDATRAFFSSLGRDGIFLSEMGRIQAVLEQLDSDIDYGESVCEAHTSSLRAVSDHLRIAGERHLGEMAHHLSIDSAAVVASIFAVIAVEIALRDHASSPAAWFLSLFLIAGSFGGTQILSSRWRGAWLERTSLALAAGCLACYLVLSFGYPRYLWDRLLPSLRGNYVVLLVVVFLGASISVALVHWLVAKRRTGRRPWG